jgi:hypothetical protein
MPSGMPPPRRKRGQSNPKADTPGDPMQWWLRNRGDLDEATDRDLERSCTSKNPYASEDDARAHAAMNRMSDVLYAYHCRYCDMWHLTRRPS